MDFSFPFPNPTPPRPSEGGEGYTAHQGGLQGCLLALEGGGSRSQAVLMDGEGCVLHTSQSSDVNVNFVPFGK